MHTFKNIHVRDKYIKICIKPLPTAPTHLSSDAMDAGKLCSLT